MATMSDEARAAVPSKVREDLPAIRLVGTGPCPNGCGRESERWEMMGVEAPPVLCDECQAEANAEREREEREEIVGMLLHRAGLDAGKFAEWSLASYPRDAAGASARRAANAWLRTDPRPNLYLHGETGAGKTGLVVGMLREVVERDLALVRLVNWLDYLEALRESYGQPGDAPPLLHGLDRVPVLCIDDLGAERPTEWALEQTATLVERRHREALPTIVTSNYSPEELAGRLGRDEPVVGRRIVSRLGDGAVVVRVGGKDRRTATAAA
jgi:DNA replication protein DnaC